MGFDAWDVFHAMPTCVSTTPKTLRPASTNFTRSRSTNHHGEREKQRSNTTRTITLSSFGSNESYCLLSHQRTLPVSTCLPLPSRSKRPPTYPPPSCVLAARPYSQMAASATTIKVKEEFNNPPFIKPPKSYSVLDGLARLRAGLVAYMYIRAPIPDHSHGTIPKTPHPASTNSHQEPRLRRSSPRLLVQNNTHVPNNHNALKIGIKKLHSQSVLSCVYDSLCRLTLRFARSTSRSSAQWLTYH